MSKQPTSPPPGDKPVPTAPPPPPAWRHWLWPAAILVMVVLYLFLPAIHGTQTVSLTYSQFISDANAHKVKDVTFGSAANSRICPRHGSTSPALIPGLAIWSTPLMPHMSPAAIGCKVVMLRG